MKSKRTICVWVFSFENRAFYEILWDSMVEPDRPQMTIQRGRFAKSTNTHLEYVILIAFPLQQCWQKRVPLLRYTHIVCLVCE